MKAVLNGPQGRTVLESTVLTIGSSPDNSLVIDTIKVSAHHAEIRPEEQGFSIVDLGSIHGTYVNGERLDFNTPRMLSRGNSVTIGDMVFTYDIEDVQQNDATLPANLDLVGSSATPASGVESPLSHGAYGARNMCRPGSSSLTIRERFPLALLDRYLGIFLLRRYDAGIVDLSGLGWECSLL